MKPIKPVLRNRRANQGGIGTTQSAPHLEGFTGRIEVAQPEQLFRRETLSASSDGHAEPFTLQWFLAIEHQRLCRRARWIPSVLEFSKHSGETLLGLGSGLGTDWIQYARHGARVIACSPIAAELALIRRNFELRNLSGRFVHASPDALPLNDNSIDVACISGLLHEVRDAAAVVREVFRVLKPGGKVLAVVPSYYNADTWQWLIRPWSAVATRPSARGPGLNPDSGNGAVDPPTVRLHDGRYDDCPGYRAGQLKKLFGQFNVHRIHKRQVTRRDFPWVWRCVPRRWLERLFGRYLIIKAFKDVSWSRRLSKAA